MRMGARAKVRRYTLNRRQDFASPHVKTKRSDGKTEGSVERNFPSILTVPM
jgi:hypothetical protein